MPTKTVQFADVAAWVSGRASENDVLEWKREFWAKDKALELAKDLAAFLNADGGTIVVGIEDEGGAASGWSTKALPPNAEQTVAQHASQYLMPESAARHVRAFPLTGEPDGTTRTVLLIQVDPWPHGPVAVASVNTYRFPIRVGAHTAELPWEEIMVRSEAGHRRHAIRFAEWKRAHAALKVVVSSRVRLWRTQSGQTREITLPMTDDHIAVLDAVAPDAVVLRMVRTDWARNAATVGSALLDMLVTANPTEADALFVNLIRQAEQQNLWNSAVNVVRMPIPYDVVRAAWLEDRAEPRLHLLLDVDILFNGRAWVLRVA